MSLMVNRKSAFSTYPKRSQQLLYDNVWLTIPYLFCFVVCVLIFVSVNINVCHFQHLFLVV